MSALLHLLILAGLLAVIGILTEPPGTRRTRWGRGLAFLGAAGIALLLVLTGLVILIAVIGAYIGLTVVVGAQVGVFLGLVLAMVASGVLLFLAVRPLLQRWGVTHEWMTIVEYYIQWSLIYVTIYQVIVENLGGLGKLVGDGELTVELGSYLSTVLDPKVLIVLLLPVLISVWIATAMTKLRIEAQNRDEGDWATLTSQGED